MAARKAPAKKAAPKKVAAKKAAPAKRPAAKATAKKAAPPPAVAEQLASVTALRPGQKSQGRNAARHNPTTPGNLAIAERRARALNLRRAGLTYQQIADQIGGMYNLPNYVRQRAQEDVEAMRDELVVEPARDMLYADLDRVNALMTAVWPTAMKGDPKAVHQARGLLADRAKYLGLYSPVRHILTGPDGGPVQVQDLADPAAAYAAALAALDDVLPPGQQALPGAP